MFKCKLLVRTMSFLKSVNWSLLSTRFFVLETCRKAWAFEAIVRIILSRTSGRNVHRSKDMICSPPSSLNWQKPSFNANSSTLIRAGTKVASNVVSVIHCHPLSFEAKSSITGSIHALSATVDHYYARTGGMFVINFIHYHSPSTTVIWTMTVDGGG